MLIAHPLSGPVLGIATVTLSPPYNWRSPANFTDRFEYIYENSSAYRASFFAASMAVDAKAREIQAQQQNETGELLPLQQILDTLTAQIGAEGPGNPLWYPMAAPGVRVVGQFYPMWRHWQRVNTIAGRFDCTVAPVLAKITEAVITKVLKSAGAPDKIVQPAKAMLDAQMAAQAAQQQCGRNWSANFVPAIEKLYQAYGYYDLNEALADAVQLGFIRDKLAVTVHTHAGDSLSTVVAAPPRAQAVGKLTVVTPVGYKPAWPSGTIAAQDPKINGYRIAVSLASVAAAHAAGLTGEYTHALLSGLMSLSEVSHVEFSPVAAPPPGVTVVSLRDFQTRTGTVPWYAKWTTWAGVGGGLAIVGLGAAVVYKMKRRRA